MISKVPSDLKILCVYEILHPLLSDNSGRDFTEGVYLGGGGGEDDALPRPAAPLWQYLCENSNFFFFSD